MITPTRSFWSPRSIVRISFFAACASSVILARGRTTVRSAAPGAVLPGWTCRLDVRTERAADQLHDVVEAPADHVDEFAVLALAHGDDAIGGLDLTGLLRRAAGQDFHDRHVVVDHLQRRADALVGQAHLDPVFLGIARREIAGVRVEHVRERVHEILEHVVGGDLLAALGGALVALGQHVAGFFPGLVGEHQRDRVVLDALAPQLVELLAVLRPGRLAPVELETLVEREIGFLLQHGERVLHPLAAAQLEAVEDREGRLQPSAADRVVQLIAVALELGDVGGEEIAPRPVQRLEVAVEHQRGDGIVDRRLAVVRALEHAAHEPGDPRVAIGGREIRRRGAGGRGGCLRRPEQQRGQRDHDGGERHRSCFAQCLAASCGLVLAACLIHFARFLDRSGSDSRLETAPAPIKGRRRKLPTTQATRTCAH